MENFISLGQRERKKNYDVNADYIDALLKEKSGPGGRPPDIGPDGKKREIKSRARRFHMEKYHDWQFYDPRMQELQNMEEKMFHERQQQLKLIRKLLALKPSQRGLVNRWNAGKRATVMRV